MRQRNEAGAGQAGKGFLSGSRRLVALTASAQSEGVNVDMSWGKRAPGCPLSQGSRCLMYAAQRQPPRKIYFYPDRLEKAKRAGILRDDCISV